MAYSNIVFLFSSCNSGDQYWRGGCTPTSPSGHRQAGVMTALSNRGHVGWCGSSWVVWWWLQLSPTQYQMWGIRIGNVQCATNYWLRRHMDIHKGSRHPCSSCHKSLSSCKMLGQHDAACKQGRKHICTLCNKEYSSVQILKTHEEVHHGATWPQPGQSFPCPHCGKGLPCQEVNEGTCWHLCSKSLQKGALLLLDGGLPQGEASLFQDEEPELPSGRSSRLEGAQGVNSDSVGLLTDASGHLYPISSHLLVSHVCF